MFESKKFTAAMYMAVIFISQAYYYIISSARLICKLIFGISTGIGLSNLGQNLRCFAALNVV